MNKTDARAFLNLFSDLETHHTCEHGHADCSTTPAGPCLDDVIRDAVIHTEETQE